MGLVLFDIHNDVVSGKILVFDNILDFLRVIWPQKWNKTVNFGYVLFPFKYLILKHYSESAFVLWETYLWSKFQQIRVIFVGETAQKPRKSGYIMDAASPWKYLKIHNLTITNATLKKLTTIIYFHKTLNLAE